MTKPHIQRIRSYPLREPTLTYSKKEISLKVNVSSNILVDEIRWSANSTDTAFSDEEWEGTESTRMYFSDNDEVFMK